MTFWSRAASLPPILVRLLARRRHGPPLTDAEIAQASGLSVHQVFILSQCTSWEGIDLPTMRKFLIGCEADFENSQHMDRIDYYLRAKPAPTWKFLRKSPSWNSFYKPLMLKYRRSLLQSNLK